MKKIYLSLAILAGIGLAGCNDSFLEHAPVTSLTENNAFRSYDNFKSFAWPCYEIFKDNNIAVPMSRAMTMLSEEFRV